MRMFSCHWCSVRIWHLSRRILRFFPSAGVLSACDLAFLKFCLPGNPPKTHEGHVSRIWPGGGVAQVTPPPKTENPLGFEPIFLEVPK